MQTHTQVIISLKAQKILFQDVYRRRHIEACGILLGNRDESGNWHLEEAHPLRNIFNSPVYFEFAPEDLLAMELDYPGRIVGVYHSHPTGMKVASSTDRKNMKRINVEQHIPWVWLIMAGPFDELSLTNDKGQYTSVSLLAYYHYEREGLKKIPLILEENTAQEETSAQQP